MKNPGGMSIFVLFGLLAAALQITNGFGQKRSVVGKQTWGYVSVRPGAFMFWWLYYTTGPESYLKTPLVLWLQGGPGASSTGYGNFQEIGPQDVNLKNRSISWVNYTNVLFVDNPVGTGFSYVNDTKLLTKNNDEIADDLMALISGFLQKVPEFQSIPLYIFSESYGGKMAALFALRLNKAITAGKIKCNLKSVSFGDSWISPIDSVLTWAPYLFSTSFIDNAGFSAINKSAHAVKDAIDKDDFAKATALWETTESLVSKTTNGVSFYNILATETTLNDSKSKFADGSLDRATKHLSQYHSDSLSTLMNGKIKEMLRIIPANVSWGGQSKEVFEALEGDFMKPVVRVVESLLNNTPIAVNVYNGQLDLIVDTMGTMRWVEKMVWAGIPGWKSSKRRPISLNGKTEGFVKSFKTFNFYWILKAGHMVPEDSPETGAELLQLITGLRRRSEP